MAGAGARRHSSHTGSAPIFSTRWFAGMPLVFGLAPLTCPLLIAAPHAHQYSCRVNPLTQSKENRMDAKVGSAAPDFTLASHTDLTFGLASFRGRRTVVSFLPFA